MKKAEVQAWFIIFVITIAITLAGAFVIGGWWSCDKGGGTLSNGFRCINITLVGACTIENKTYIDSINIPFGERVESYKACLNHLDPPPTEVIKELRI